MILRDTEKALTDLGNLAWKAENHARMAEIAQHFANLEYLYRAPRGFNPDFTPKQSLTAELVAFLAALEREDAMISTKTAILNPIFVHSCDLINADADLIVDDALIDFKCVTDPRPKLLDHVLQLSGYAVLQRLGGIRLDAATLYHRPFVQVGLYFARHGKLVAWNVEDLFSASSFDKFEKHFLEELGKWKRERTFGVC